MRHNLGPAKRSLAAFLQWNWGFPCANSTPTSVNMAEVHLVEETSRVPKATSFNAGPKAPLRRSTEQAPNVRSPLAALHYPTVAVPLDDGRGERHHGAGLLF